jgi:tight adherence protein C
MRLDMNLRLSMDLCVGISSSLVFLLVYCLRSQKRHPDTARLVRRGSQSVLWQLPFCLDVLALCLEAGMNLHHAFRHMLRKVPLGLLRSAFEQVLVEIRLGQAWTQAWRNLADRFPSIEIQQLAALLIHAEQLGLALAPILHAQSEQYRQIYFARAEKQALETPVKILLPLVLFIFPCSFIVLGFPIAYQLFFLWF